MRAALPSLGLILVACLDLVSAAALNQRANPSSQVSSCHNILKNEKSFCRAWLNGQTPPHSIVATVKTTKIVKGSNPVVTSTPTLTKTKTVKTTLSLTTTTSTTHLVDVVTSTTAYTTDVSTFTESYALATTTLYSGQFAEKRSGSIAKLRSVEQFTAEIITEACLLALYGTTKSLQTKTQTITSTQSGKSHTVVARPATATTSTLSTVTTLASTETDVQSSTVVVGTVTSLSRISTSTTTTQVFPSTLSVGQAAPTPDTSCGNVGIQWAYYNADRHTPDSCDLDPTETYSWLKTASPGETSTATDFQSQTCGCYNLGVFKPFNGPYESACSFYLQMRAYLFAPYTGTYEFSLTQGDDQAVAWIGEDAFSGFTNANSDVAYTCSATQGLTSVTKLLLAGSYTPVRVVWVQKTAAGNVAFSIQDPFGNTIAGRGDSDPLLVQYSCDATSAPAFAAFGSET